MTKHYLTPNIDANGRYRVCISIEGDCYAVPVHKLVYLAFYGELADGMTINHINENPLDNRYTNLEQVTRGDNVRLYREHNGAPDKKYSDMLITAICMDLKSGIYYKDVAAAYTMPIGYIFNILKGRRRTFISKDFMPFPESAHRRNSKRDIPHDYIDSLILQHYSNDEILQLLDCSRTSATDKMFARARRKLNCPAPEYFSVELLHQVDCLVEAGKCNKEILNILGLPYNNRNANMLARSRQKLGILDFNPNGVSLDDQNEIIIDIENGLSNAEIATKWGLTRTPYVVNMLARLRQKVKKMHEEGSTTIERVPQEEILEGVTE